MEMFGGDREGFIGSIAFRWVLEDEGAAGLKFFTAQCGEGGLWRRSEMQIPH